MTLKKGDSGQQVLRLQAALQRMGIALPQYGIDGKFGPETEAAVRQAQRRFSLPATGVANQVLLQRLNIPSSSTGVVQAGNANSHMMKKTILAGIAIGGLFVLVKKFRSKRK
ncbi:MAG: peptidoglycan-binding domain-containing protein [Gracilimonas sp.]